MNKAYAIKGPDSVIKINTIRGSVQHSWAALPQRKGRTLANLKSNGYRCVPVQIVELPEPPK